MGAAPRTDRRLRVERSRRVVERGISEAAFQRQVMDLAQLHGWRVSHFRAARTRDGRTITPVAGDGAGFPDLVLCHRERGVLFRELKTDRGRLRDTQVDWLDDLDAAGADASVWRPGDWADIEATLRGAA